MASRFAIRVVQTSKLAPARLQARGQRRLAISPLRGSRGVSTISNASGQDEELDRVSQPIPTAVDVQWIAVEVLRVDLVPDDDRGPGTLQ